MELIEMVEHFEKEFKEDDSPLVDNLAYQNGKYKMYFVLIHEKIKSLKLLDELTHAQAYDQGKNDIRTNIKGDFIDPNAAFRHGVDYYKSLKKPTIGFTDFRHP